MDNVVPGDGNIVKEGDPASFREDSQKLSVVNL